MSKSRVVTHQFMPAGIRDGRGVRICGCGSTEEASVHRVPERSDDERALEARKVGERQ